MAGDNHYRSPGSQVDGGGTVPEYGDVRIFGVSGRVGRVRYLAYSFGINLLVMLFIGAMVGLASMFGQGAGIFATILMAVAYIFMLVYAFMVTIQRAHDFNSSGWMSLLLFVPLASLIFLFIPGTKGENSYGAQPPPNSAGNVILALIMPIVFVVGILAAIAIPAYNGYIKQAQLMQQQETQQQQLQQDKYQQDR